MKRKGAIGYLVNIVAVTAMLITSGCAAVGIPEARNVDIPSPTMADSRKKAINERPDSVMYLPLGEDVLVPEVAEDDAFPSEMVGPFELRGETLAGALQLILADYDISLAFETQEGLTRRITVANLRGDLGKVVHKVCSLANLYCSYEDGTIVIKDSQTFTVTLPPLGAGDDATYLENVSAGLAAILGTGASSSGGNTAGTASAPIVDATTRTIIYSATQRTADVATRYFQRLRANTAMIVFETYIWEVSLNSGNSTGINWSNLDSFGKFRASFTLDGSVAADFTNPVSIGLPTTQGGNPTDIVEFLSQFGAVKTISQPQIAVLSGSEAELRVADTQNYVSQIATTLDEGQSTTSVNTDSVDTGFTLTIGSSWDKATVYANVNIELTDVKQIDNFAFADTGDDGGSTTIQLPQTSERQLTTQIRVRPGDSVLIAGLVRENDNFDTDGIGLMEPIIPQSRTAQTDNLELVILLRPRVIVYTAANDRRYVDYAMKKHKLPGTGVEITSPMELGEKPVTGPDPEQDNFPAPLISDSRAPVSANPMTSPAPVTPVPLPILKMPPAMAPAPTPAPPPKPVVNYVPPVTPQKAAAKTPDPAPPVPVAKPVAKAAVPVPVSKPAKTATPASGAAAPANTTPAAAAPKLGNGFISKAPSDSGQFIASPAPEKSADSKVTPPTVPAKPSTVASPKSPAISADENGEETEPAYETYDEMSPVF